MKTPLDINSFSVRLDDLVKETRAVLTDAHRLVDANELGEAARVPDDLARVICVLSDCRNAAAYEASSRMEQVA